MDFFLIIFGSLSNKFNISSSFEPKYLGSNSLRTIIHT